MAGDNVEVLMPLMGEGITEATLVKWLKKPGEAVKKDEPLLEVSTDKVDTEIPSPAAGFLVEVFAADGTTVPVNDVIAHIANEQRQAGSKAAPAAPKAAATPNKTQPAEPTPAAMTAPAALSPAGNLRSSPLVRKMAKAQQVDLNQVPGSGLNGRITKRDLEDYLASGASKPSQPSAAAPAKASHVELASERLVTRSVDGVEQLEGVAVRREKMSRMRQLIAAHMISSVKTSPHVTTVFEIDLHQVVKVREQYKNAFAAREGFNLTFTAFFIHATAQAIKRHPIVNVSVDGDDILWKDSINIGCAVAIESGLIVPVIKNAGELNLLGVARRLNDLVVRARSKKLTPEDVQGGTFSITNPGMYGSIVSSPIINQPQVAILSIGAIIKRPVVVDDMIAIRPLVQIGLTFDHRVIDGEGGARYLATLKEILENYSESPL